MSAVLLAAVADTLAEHDEWTNDDHDGQSDWVCASCGHRLVENWASYSIRRAQELHTRERAAHQAERVVARLTELLPRLPAEDVAALIGGTVERVGRDDDAPWQQRYVRVVGPLAPVPDSPPATEGGE